MQLRRQEICQRKVYSAFDTDKYLICNLDCLFEIEPFFSGQYFQWIARCLKITLKVYALYATDYAKSMYNIARTLCHRADFGSLSSLLFARIVKVERLFFRFSLSW